MITVRLKGGLGNQLFQYAVGRALALKNKDRLHLDISYFSPNAVPFRQYELGVFSIVINGLSSEKTMRNVFLPIIGKFLPVKGIEKSYAFDNSILNIKGDCFLEGYFQSEKYFNDCADVVRQDITLKNPSPVFVEKSKEMKIGNTVSVHIRRGDYVGNPHHPTMDLSYYQKGIEEIEKKTPIDMVVVFSDDIAWCQEHIKFDYKTIFINKKELGLVDAEELLLMSHCKHFIIANSSFSWWGAWLASNPDKMVIAPKKWFGDDKKTTGDLIPANWIRI